MSWRVVASCAAWRRDAWWRKLFPVQAIHLEAAIESAVARAEPANADKLARLFQIPMEDFAGNSLVEHEESCSAGPFADNGKGAGNAGATAALAVCVAHEGFAFRLVSVDAKHHGLGAEKASGEMLGPRGLPFTWDLLPQVLGNLHQSIFKSHRRDVNTPLLIAVLAVSPVAGVVGLMSLLFQGWHFIFGEETGLRIRGDGAEFNDCGFHGV